MKQKLFQINRIGFRWQTESERGKKPEATMEISDYAN
jgi:hypothetical protein